MTPTQRAKQIRKMHDRLAAIEAEKRQIQASLLPLETEESWSMGYRLIVRGERLLAAMDARDAVSAAA